MRRIGAVLTVLLLLLSPAWAQTTTRTFPELYLSLTGGTMSGPLVLPAGTAPIRSLRWDNMGVNDGFYSYGAPGAFGLALGWGGANYYTFEPGAFKLTGTTASVLLGNAGTWDTQFIRDNAAYTGALKNADNQMSWRTYGGFSSYEQSSALHELITLSLGGTTTDSAANLLPADSYIEGVVVRVTTAVTGAGVTSLSIGDGTIAGRFCTLVGLPAGTTKTCITHLDLTGTSGPKQVSAAKLRITAVGATPTAGIVRVIVYYRTWSIPAT